MRQEEAVAIVSERVGLVKSDVRLVITAYNELNVETLEKGDDVCMTGIGKIRAWLKKGRMGRNPKTGEPLIIPDKTVVKISVCKSLKDLLNSR
jgi:DNA-binding protein HU-beta